MRVAGLQTAGTPGDVAANLRELDRMAEEAAALGADLLVTPELFVTGYDIGERLFELAKENPLPAVRDIAVRRGLAILVGFAESTEEGLYNSAVMMDRDGCEMLRYRKQHLFGELDRHFFLPGDANPETVSFMGVRMAAMICYDVEFPEYVRATALAGCELLIVPTAQMEPFTFVAREVIRARAWENQIYLAYINHDGREGNTRYVGNSQIVAPDASVLARIEHGDGLIVADVEPGLVARAQRENPYLEDRRPSAYGSLVSDTRKERA
ncbi:carbon-nitrogen hydrolase family protein [Acetobacter sp.]|jgi:predicted amidohydrolase|uniref:carbon-nitrogen hydrolase family protein n=1 Tax=Acetobacter sp. TaxID=440 RepID=UPI0025C33C38|nr:carbon-nitrogen hydrolase family protein [Acetobacter sp.]MCH4090003.1 carbon-nitrogen hydrolase family protein [Acetobacter sp.]MCI1298699.1 carbon-nitrogen hydrolase family protein [Acetobacter sp.]MCI1315264.1 carbon-nitrogen hydrolase family protein [Acetobacter sp.]